MVVSRCTVFHHFQASLAPNAAREGKASLVVLDGSRTKELGVGVHITANVSDALLINT